MHSFVVPIMKIINKRKVIEEHLVGDLKTTETIYEYLPGKLDTIPSRKGVKKAFSRKQLLLNGEISSSLDRVKNTDLITVLEYRGAVTKEYKLELTIHFEDEHVAIVEKPPGLATSGNQWKTLQNALPANIQPSLKKDALSVPLTVHRLDAKTHGLVIVAKTASARIELGRMFESRKVHKTYTAVLQGKLTEEGIFNKMIEGKEAITDYKVLSHFKHVKDDWNTLVELSPVTGRKHQLRIHCAQSGHPIVGDVKYSDKENVLRGKGIFLSANKLRFPHPFKDDLIEITIPLPAKFKRYIDRMARWVDRTNT